LKSSNGRFDDQEIGKGAHPLSARTFKTAPATMLRFLSS